MKPTTLAAIGLFILLTGQAPAQATPDLYAWMFNIDGIVTEYINEYDTSGMPVDASLDPDDLGVFTYTESIAGAHSLIGFWDYEMDETANTFFNELGAVQGSPAPGQSWQIGSIDNYDPGNIWDNVWDGSLNNTNTIPVEGDVSWAMGWEYFLNPGETAVIRMTVSAVLPEADFFLLHMDNDTGERIYLSGDFSLQAVPEPQSMVLLGLGMLLLARGASSRLRRNHGNGK